MPVIIAVLTCLLMPALLIILCQRVKILDKLGVVVLSFGLGIALSGFLDLPALFSGGDLTAAQISLTEISIALALPLLLFSINVKHSMRMAGDTMKSMVVAVVAVVIVTVAGAFLFKDALGENIWQIAGMSVGAYTGGGVNMAAIKTAIAADENIFITMNTYDILLSAIYLIFVMTIAKSIFGLFLRSFSSSKAGQGEESENEMAHMADETANSYKSLVKLKAFPQTLLAIVFSGVAVGLALGFSSLLPESVSSGATIVSITTFGLMGSFIPFIRKLTNSFQAGMYLILVFCFAMGSMTDVRMLAELNYDLFAYIGFILLGSMVIQVIICKMLKIDIDTFMITSSAAIMSVPFIPVIAGVLKNREIMLPGFAAAIIGYALGNYLGVLVAYSTRYLLGL